MKRIPVELWLSALSDRTGDNPCRSSEVPQLTKFDCEINESNVYIAPFNKNFEPELARGTVALCSLQPYRQTPLSLLRCAAINKIWLQSQLEQCVYCTVQRPIRMKKSPVERQLRALSNRAGDDPRRFLDMPQSTIFDHELN